MLTRLKKFKYNIKKYKMKIIEYICFTTKLPLLQCFKNCNNNCNTYKRNLNVIFKYGIKRRIFIKKNNKQKIINKK